MEGFGGEDLRNTFRASRIENIRGGRGVAGTGGRGGGVQMRWGGVDVVDQG
jgi:hypothetical protein